jgi:hypothetical protein
MSGMLTCQPFLLLRGTRDFPSCTSGGGAVVGQLRRDAGYCYPSTSTLINLLDLRDESSLHYPDYRRRERDGFSPSR